MLLLYCKGSSAIYMMGGSADLRLCGEEKEWRYVKAQTAWDRKDCYNHNTESFQAFAKARC